MVSSRVRERLCLKKDSGIQAREMHNFSFGPLPCMYMHIHAQLPSHVNPHKYMHTHIIHIVTIK